MTCASQKIADARKRETTKPKRIQRKRTKGWRKPDGAVIVDRTSRFGNPFKIGDCWRSDRGDAFLEKTVNDAETAVRFFSDMLDYPTRPYPTLDELVTALHGKDLVCWCPLDQPCHADVLLKIMNEVKA